MERKLLGQLKAIVAAALAPVSVKLFGDATLAEMVASALALYLSVYWMPNLRAG